ncbi:hypothetical protein [Streptomyces sp. NPDC052225]|uniref:hypothetical protein n=1 Tax=Streptomyces sp. NPDC052225 TaxID=3154949 RepID=UPI003427B1DC
MDPGRHEPPLHPRGRGLSRKCAWAGLVDHTLRAFELLTTSERLRATTAPRPGAQ